MLYRHANRIGSTAACAFVRHAYGVMYRDFSLVDTAGHRFVPVETFRRAVYSFRDAVFRYGESIRRFKIKRRFTHKKKHVPEDALTRFAQLITFDADTYRHTLTPAFKAAITHAEGEVKAYHDARVRQRAARGRGLGRGGGQAANP